MEGYYSLLKLTTGEELIAKVVNDDGGNYLIEDPVHMFRNVAPNGMTWIQCSHWLLFNKTSLVNVKKDHVLAIVEDLNDNVIINYKTFLEAGYMEQNMKEKMERDERQGGNEGEARKAISVAMIANNSVH